MIRLIIKGVFQPPIDTPASILYRTFDIENPELEKLLKVEDYTTFLVVGSEVIPAHTEKEKG